LREGKAQAETLADAAREQVETLRDTVGRVAQDGSEALASTAKEVGAQAKGAQDAATDAVRRNPGLAIAGAVGVGVLLGLALSRRS
jgi:ElaB/YqjD/DUF883 family membrane-anchored ribosome-binding protein